MNTATNADQATFWESQAGPKWVRHSEKLDRFFAPVTQAVLAKAGLRPGERVLDVGCGAGSSSLLAGQHVLPDGKVDGFDISKTLLALAKDRAAAAPQLRIEFIHGDAEVYAFQRARYDAMISRFGVMFFADPVAAFANMRPALTPGGRMVFAAWGRVSENPFFTISAAAIRAVFGEAPPRPDLDAPGPFAFRDPDRVIAILTQAGFQSVDVDIQKIPLPIAGGPQEVLDLWREIGPMERAFEFFAATEAQRDAVYEKVLEALEAYQSQESLIIPSEINVFSARAG
ncbi:MAG: class I SAM-dependent methyltransferase [Pseudomonadota bacterium]